MGDFCFLHAADLHVDSPMRGLERYEGAPVEELRAATRRAVEALVEVAVERGVRFVILAGDLFDGEWPDYGTGLWFLKALRPLLDAEIPVYFVKGNHDAESKVQKRLSLPDGVHRFPSAKPRTFKLEELGVALHGQSYAEVHVHDDLAADYPDPVPGMLNIGVLHTGLEGGHDHGDYAPCTLAQLQGKGYDYWALGHVHARQVLSEDPWVVFPGNTQGRHARETGPKGVTLVHVEGGQIARLEEVHTDVARWARVSVDLEGADEWAQLAERAKEALLKAVEGAEGRSLAARVVLTGATALDSELRVDGARVRAEVRAAALTASDAVWIEKVQLGTGPVNSGLGTEGGLADLLASVRDAELDEDEVAGLSADLARLQERLSAPGVEARPAERASIEAALDPARHLLASLLSGAAPEEADGA